MDQATGTTFDQHEPSLLISKQPLPIKYLQTAGASSGEVPTYNGTTVVWQTPAVAPGAITLTDAHILVGNAANDATDVAVTGDISITNTGVTAIASGVIVNADVNASAAIEFSKLEALTSANILVGSAGNVATSVAMSGDVTISDAGVTAIGANKVTKAMLATGITPSHMIVFAGQPTTVGGAAAEAIAVVGALATDLAFVQMVDDGTNNVTIVNAVVTNDTLTVTFSADPGNDAVINYQIVRATS